MAFYKCSGLNQVVFNKNLKTIGDYLFERCPNLEDVQLASSAVFFDDTAFCCCDRLIDIAAAAGFSSARLDKDGR